MSSIKDVLIVSDSPILQEECSTLLLQINELIRAVAIATLSETKEYLKKRTPDLIMLDYLLSDGNGLELYQWFHQNQSIKTPPIVLITGYSNKPLIQIAIKLGTVEVIDKSQITLPRLERAILKAEEKIHKSERNQGFNVKVLIIDILSKTIKKEKQILENDTNYIYEITTAETYAETETLLNYIEPDIILYDDDFKSQKPYPFIEKLIQTIPDIPIIVTPSKSDDIGASRAIEAGVFDYIPVKLLTHERVVHSIFRALEKRAHKTLVLSISEELKELQTLNEELDEKLKRLTWYDPLLEIPNRRSILSIISRELSRVKREQDKDGVSVSIIRIANLGYTNDAFGTKAGDLLLTTVTEVISSSIRSYDYLGRFGSSTLMLVATHSSSEGTLDLWKRLLESLQKERIVMPTGTIPVTVHIGTAFSYGSHDTEELLKSADAALYETLSQKGMLIASKILPETKELD